MHSCSLRLLRSSFVLCFNNILQGSASKQPELAQHPCEEVTVLYWSFVIHSFIHSLIHSSFDTLIHSLVFPPSLQAS